MTRAEPSSHPAAGFSLPELLVSVMLLLSAMSTVTMLLGHMATSHRTVWNRTEMHSAVRGATELLQQEVGQPWRATPRGRWPMRGGSGRKWTART